MTPDPSPRDGAAPGPGDLPPLDMAADALAHARRMARRRPVAAAARTRRRPSGPRPARLLEPVPVGTVLLDLLAPARLPGWDEQLWQAWHAAIGKDVARHVTPTGFDHSTGALSVRTDSSAWGIQLRLLAPVLISRLTATSGHTIRILRVFGPKTPTPPQQSATAAAYPGAAGHRSVQDRFGHITSPAPRGSGEQALREAADRQAQQAVREPSGAATTNPTTVRAGTPSTLTRTERVRLRALRRARSAGPSPV